MSPTDPAVLQDVEAEAALAVSLVNVPHAWDYVSHVLVPGMLTTEPAHGIVAAVDGCVRDGQRVTPTAVAARLGGRAIPRWNDPALSRAPEELEPLARRVRELWARRQLVDLGTTLLEQAYTTPSRNLADRVATVLSRVEDTSSRADTADRVIARRLDQLRHVLDADGEAEAPVLSYDTGFRALDYYLGGLRPGRLVVFAARPSNGKTAFATAIADNLASSGVPVGVFYLEDEEEDFADRLLARHYQIPADALRGRSKERLRGQVFARTELGLDTDSHARIVLDDTHGLTAADVVARMRRMHREHGCRVFIADHLGEIDRSGDRSGGGRDDLALGSVVRRYRDAAKDLHAVPILLSQMNRRVEQRGNDSTPRMSDLDGSGQIEQAARVVAFLELARGGDNAEAPCDYNVLISKNTSGRTGLVQLRWNPETATVVNP